MTTTVLSTKGQVIIPNPIRTAHQWRPGQRFVAIDTGEGVLLKPTTPFPKTDIQDVASCLRYQGRTKTIEEMNKAIARGVEESSHDRG